MFVDMSLMSRLNVANGIWKKSAQPLIAIWLLLVFQLLEPS